MQILSPRLEYLPSVNWQHRPGTATGFDTSRGRITDKISIKRRDEMRGQCKNQDKKWVQYGDSSGTKFGVAPEGEKFDNMLGFAVFSSREAAQRNLRQCGQVDIFRNYSFGKETMFKCDECGELFDGDNLKPVQYATGSTGQACPKCLEEKFETEPTISNDGLAVVYWKK
jgi:hypothetical protein